MNRTLPLAPLPRQLIINADDLGVSAARDAGILDCFAAGAMLALAARPPLWIAATVVGAFAVFHGHAHGTELPQAANALAFSAGFVIATGLLHLSGIAFGLIVKWPKGRIAVRVVGGAIAAAGVGFLVGVF